MRGVFAGCPPWLAVNVEWYGLGWVWDLWTHNKCKKSRAVLREEKLHQQPAAKKLTRLYCHTESHDPLPPTGRHEVVRKPITTHSNAPLGEKRIPLWTGE